jgi:hypothetical protein
MFIHFSHENPESDELLNNPILNPSESYISYRLFQTQALELRNNEKKFLYSFKNMGLNTNDPFTKMHLENLKAQYLATSLMSIIYGIVIKPSSLKDLRIIFSKFEFVEIGDIQKIIQEEDRTSFLHQIGALIMILHPWKPEKQGKRCAKIILLFLIL